MASSSCEALSCVVGGGSNLIEDEKFDFDVPISPTDYDVREINDDDVEDEDEVFFGPVGHRERCVTVNSGLQDDEKFKPLSPLNGEQIAELFKEATAVSIFIKNSSLSQSLGNENVTDEKENRDICKLLSKTFSVDEDQEYNETVNEDQENYLRTAKSASSPESVDSISSQPAEFPDDMITPVTPRRILQERNFQSQSSGVLQSPFKGRKARPLQNTSKFVQSKLPKTQMTLKTRSCFNSPIKVDHLYGIKKPSSGDEKVNKANDDGRSPSKSKARGSSKGDPSFTESSKLPLPSQSGIRPPGFGVQPRRRRTSSSSSVSSTSSAVSVQSSDLNETFVVSKGSSSDIPSIPTVCARKAPATKACLKPVNGTSALTKPTFAKPKGRPQPVKALPQPATNSKKAPPTPNGPLKSKRMPSTPGRRQSGTCTEQMVTRSQTPSSVQRSKSFTTPIRANRSSIPAGQPVRMAQTPTKGKNPAVPLTPRRRGSVTPTKGKNPVVPLTPRRRGSVTPRASTTTVPTPVRRRNSGSVAAAPSQTSGKNTPRPSTPEHAICSSSDSVTPPNSVPNKETKRKSMSAGGQKRRSLLPTPARSRITRSQSQKSRPNSISSEIPGALPFSISPSAEVKPRSAAVLTSPPDLSLEPSHSNTRLSDPFSPASQLVTIDPISDCPSGDSVARNLIEWSPAIPREGNLIDI